MRSRVWVPAWSPNRLTPLGCLDETTRRAKFVPDVLAAVGFAGGPGMDDLLQAVAILGGLYATKARKVPDGAPDGFVPAGGPGTSRMRGRQATSPPSGTTGSCAC